MADTPDDITTRRAEARRLAVSDLTTAISSIRDTDDYAAYLPAITSFSKDLFDAEACEWIVQCDDEASFEDILESEVAPPIIEGILPDRGLQKIMDALTDEIRQLEIEADLETNVLEEVACDGTRQLARKEIQAPYASHGDWENFMPKRVQFALRWPSIGGTVRNALTQCLQRRSIYWTGQFSAHVGSILRGNTRREQVQCASAKLAPLTTNGDVGIQAHELVGNSSSMSLEGMTLAADQSMANPSASYKVAFEQFVRNEWPLIRAFDNRFSQLVGESVGGSGEVEDLHSNQGNRRPMPLFVTSIQVTVVRNAGGTEETQFHARVGGDMVGKVLFSAEDRPKTGDEIHSELFDEPRLITRVDPVLMNTGVSHWKASIVPKSELIRLHPSQGRPESVPAKVAVAPDRMPNDEPVDDETPPPNELDPIELDRGKARSAWLDAKRGGKKWTSDVDIQNNGGPTYNTIQRYRSGRKSTHDPGVRLKFATAFGCDLADVPE